MRGVAAIVALGLALLVSGCDANDRQYFREGIGTELYTADTASATELQNIYLDYLCRQSSPYVGTDVPTCSQQIVQANFWPVIVQAGMNDIDARCDSYLAWLDLKKRENAGILAELGAVRFAVDALTIPSQGISQMGLAAVSAAFGLANGTVNNFNSLLLQVDHTTVQNVVFSNRHIFRESLLKHLSEIDNKPAAIHTLRTYLSICMPMTIAASINSTVTVFQQTGSGAGAGPMAPTIGAPFTPREPFKGRTPPGGKLQPVPGAETIIDGYPGNAQIYPPEVIANILSALCAPTSEQKGITTVTQALLDIWERTDTQNAKVGSKIGDRERKILLALTSCPSGISNAFERVTFVTPEDVGLLVTLLAKTPPVVGQLRPDATLAEARPKIALVRQKCFVGKLRTLPDSMNVQVTPDLMSALRAYSKKRAEAETQATASGTALVLPPC